MKYKFLDIIRPDNITSIFVRQNKDKVELNMKYYDGEGTAGNRGEQMWSFSQKEATELGSLLLEMSQHEIDPKEKSMKEQVRELLGEKPNIVEVRPIGRW